MLVRFDPFRELDRLTEQVWGTTRHGAVPMDAYREGDRFVVSFDLPGVDPSSIDVTVEKNVLTVRAERMRAQAEGRQVIVAERPQGSFTRQLFLSDSLDSDRIDATYEHGVLTLVVPVAEQAKPRKIEITSNTNGHKVIETSSTA